MKPAKVLLAAVASSLAPLAAADEFATSLAANTPLVIPHTLNLQLDLQSRRRSRESVVVESSLMQRSPGLAPLRWPRDTDMRARLLTPELKRAPLVGWIATNLYRSKRETGWSVEVDPGDGEYRVFYRRVL